MHGNGGGTWEHCPGSDTDPSLLGQQAVPLPAPTLLHICLKEQRRKMQNYFLLSASYPSSCPWPEGYADPSRVLCSETPKLLTLQHHVGEKSVFVARCGYEPGCVCDRSLVEQHAFAKCLRVLLRSRAGGQVWDSCSLGASCGGYLDVATNVWVRMRTLTESSCTVPSSRMDRSSFPAQDFYFWAMQIKLSLPRCQAGRSTGQIIFSS